MSANPQYDLINSPTESMKEERLNPSFPVRDMTIYLERGYHFNRD